MIRDKTVFVVMAQHHLSSRPQPVNWFPTRMEADVWIEKFGDRDYWYEVTELESFSDF